MITSDILSFFAASSISERVCAPSSVKSPDLVRISDSIAAPQPSFFPVSSIRDLIYVPLPHFTFIATLGRSMDTMLISYMFTKTGGLSTVIPLLARS